MKKIWDIISGHKTQAVSIINLTVALLAGREMIQPDTVTYIAGVMVVLTGVAVGHGVKKQIKGS